MRGGSTILHNNPHVPHQSVQYRLGCLRLWRRESGWLFRQGTSTTLVTVAVAVGLSRLLGCLRLSQRHCTCQSRSVPVSEVEVSVSSLLPAERRDESRQTGRNDSSLDTRVVVNEWDHAPMTCTTLTTYFQSEVNPWEIGERSPSGFGHGFHDDAEGNPLCYQRTSRHCIVS